MTALRYAFTAIFHEEVSNGMQRRLQTSPEIRSCYMVTTI